MSVSPTGRAKGPQLMLGVSEKNEALLTGIFGLEEKSYDVMLYPSSITLKLVSGRLKKSANRKTSIKRIDGDKMEVMVKDLFGASLKRGKAKSASKVGQNLGFDLHTYSKKDDNRLKHHVMSFSHPSEVTCNSWLTEIQQILKSITGRPRLARCYQSLESHLKSDYTSNVLPIFKEAKLKFDTLESVEVERIVKDIESLDLSQYDCILVAAGDSIVTTVVDALIKKVQFDSGIVVGTKDRLQPCNIPIGIIPCGSSNTIAHTAYGTSDMVTAALDIVYGRTLNSDVMSIAYSQGGFYKFAFSAHYGFGGTIMNIVNKSRLATNRYQLAIAKALTKSKFRAYNCEVTYKEAAESCGKPGDTNVCRAGCSTCHNDISTPCPDGSNFSDPLQEFDPLDTSNSSSQLADLSMQDESNVIKGEFLSLGLYATPSSCDMAPLGLSKYSHMADGCLDLILVHSVERKEFMRFLKRNGNAKNQLDFPFVQSARVTEVSVHVRMPVGWSYRAQNYSEINDQAKQPKNRQTTQGDELIKVVADCDTSVIRELHISDSDSSGEEGSHSASSRTGSAANASLSDQNSVSGSKASAAGHVHAIHKYTETDRRITRRNAKDLKKEMKAKDKEHKRIKSVWNVDSSLCEETDLTFRVHQKLVTLYGTGMSADSSIEDVFCFPAI
ncbi:ceramide kinase-like protein isoform X2 [Watersipora subatra]|uniref:ceramide kinase-like protein isoform X2 n=1 Tax=Watersipora subatra TaxID=2589382 RepID=UPI00355AF2D5